MPYFLVIVGILFVCNFYMLFKRSLKNRHSRKNAENRRVKAANTHAALIRRLDREQLEAAEYMERRKRTFELYEQVRSRSEPIDDPDDD